MDAGQKSHSSSVFWSTLKMALATFTSRVLGLVREQVMAVFFGASGLTDAFFVAYRIPNLLRDLFAEGAFSAAFVPTFIETLQSGRQKARELLWALFIVLLATTSLLALGIFLFSPELVAIFAPGFKDDPLKFQVTIQSTKIMAPFLVFISMAAVFMGALNSLKVFFIPSMAPASFNVAMILTLLIFPSFLTSLGHDPIYALAWGVFIGGVVQCLIQVPLLFKYSLAPGRPAHLLSAEVKKVFLLLGPGLIGFAATQINLLINTMLASQSVIGAVSYLSYAFRLFQFPVGVLSVSIANSNLVHFSEAWKAGERERALNFLRTSYDLSFLVIMPSMVLLYTLGQPLIHLIFEHGRFTAHDTQMTALAMGFYVLGLPFYGLYKIWVPTFYCLDKQKVPVYSSLISISFNILFCLYFTPRYGFQFLALGTTLSMALNCLIQSLILQSTMNLGWDFFFPLRLGKICLAAGISYVVTDQANVLLFQYDASFLKKLFLFFTTSLLGLLTYVFFLLMLGEKKTLQAFLHKKYAKKR